MGPRIQQEPCRVLSSLGPCRMGPGTVLGCLSPSAL